MYTNQEDDDLIVVGETIKKKPAQSILERVNEYNMANSGPKDKSRNPNQNQRYFSFSNTGRQQSSQQQETSSEWLDLNETVTVIKKVRIPTPNLKGGIIGKGGEKIKALRQHYHCNLSVQGAGSSADATEESARLNSGDPRHQHYAEPLHLRIECTGTASEVYANMAGVIQILPELFSGKMAAVNLEGREAMASISSGFSGHRASDQQQTSERHFSAVSSFTTIPMDQQQSTFSIPAPQGQFGSSGRGGYRGGFQRRDRGDSGGYHSHRGGMGRGGGGGWASDMQDSNGDTSTIGRGGGGGFSTSFRGGGGGGGNEFSASSFRGGGGSGTEFSSSFRGRGGGY